MPQSISIAAFIFGAVLLLVALFGGGFEIFGAKIPGKADRLGRSFAGVVGACLVIVSLLGWGSKDRPSTKLEPPVSPSSAEAPKEAAPAISRNEASPSSTGEAKQARTDGPPPSTGSQPPAGMSSEKPSVDRYRLLRDILRSAWQEEWSQRYPINGIERRRITLTRLENCEFAWIDKTYNNQIGSWEIYATYNEKANLRLIDSIIPVDGGEYHGWRVKLVGANEDAIKQVFLYKSILKGEVRQDQENPEVGLPAMYVDFNDGSQELATNVADNLRQIVQSCWSKP